MRNENTINKVEKRLLAGEPIHGLRMLATSGRWGYERHHTGNYWLIRVVVLGLAPPLPGNGNEVQIVERGGTARVEPVTLAVRPASGRLQTIMRLDKLIDDTPAAIRRWWIEQRSWDIYHSGYCGVWFRYCHLTDRRRAIYRACEAAGRMDLIDAAAARDGRGWWSCRRAAVDAVMELLCGHLAELDWNAGMAHDVACCNLQHLRSREGEEVVV